MFDGFGFGEVEVVCVFGLGLGLSGGGWEGWVLGFGFICFVFYFYFYFGEGRGRGCEESCVSSKYFLHHRISSPFLPPPPPNPLPPRHRPHSLTNPFARHVFLSAPSKYVVRSCLGPNGCG